MELKYFLNIIGGAIFILCTFLFFKARNIKWLPLGMAVDVRYDASSVNEEGSDLAWICECNADGSDLATPDTWVLLPGRADSDIKYGRKNTPRLNEKKQAFGVQRGDNPAALSFTLMQDDDKTENFLKKGKVGKFYRIVMACGISHKDTTTNKNFQKLRFFPITQIADYYEAKSGGRMPVLDITIVENPAAITFSSVSSSITDIIAKAELDATAGGSLAFSVAAREGYQATSCKMTY